MRAEDAAHRSHRDRATRKGRSSQPLPTALSYLPGVSGVVHASEGMAGVGFGSMEWSFRAEICKAGMNGGVRSL